MLETYGLLVAGFCMGFFTAALMAAGKDDE